MKRLRYGFDMVTIYTFIILVIQKGYVVYFINFATVAKFLFIVGNYKNIINLVFRGERRERAQFFCVIINQYFNKNYHKSKCLLKSFAISFCIFFSVDKMK